MCFRLVALFLLLSRVVLAVLFSHPSHPLPLSMSSFDGGGHIMSFRLRNRLRVFDGIAAVVVRKMFRDVFDGALWTN